jgi:superfamily II RNA helicase
MTPEKWKRMPQAKEIQRVTEITTGSVSRMFRWEKECKY